MNRGIPVAILASLAVGSCSSHNKVKQIPNIVFFLADDLGYGDVSCYGATSLKTPNIAGWQDKDSGSQICTAHQQPAHLQDIL